MKYVKSIFPNIKSTVFLFAWMAGLVIANAQLKCNLIEGYGNAKKESIIEQLNSSVAGLIYEDVGVANRKKLEIKEVKNIAFNGCNVTLELRVKLHRKLRRNAHGTIRVKANVTKAVLYGRKYIVITNASVDKVNLSRTLRIGERFYAWVATRTFPKKQVYYI